MTDKDLAVQEIIERLKSRRLALGYSFQDLADLTQMSKSTLQRYETGGIKNIPLSKVQVLAAALQTTPEWIMGWDTSDDQLGFKEDEVLEYLDQLHKRPEMKALFQASRKASKEDIETAITIIEALNKKSSND